MTDIASTRRAVPLAQPNISQLERDLVAEVLSSDVLAMGAFTEQFEADLAAIAHRQYG
ncbi:MAG: hypothetical protein H0U19_14930, partial [Acidobacteria bacterium]|nr:hypothetical protein [Acidobacteriota bacterium]